MNLSLHIPFIPLLTLLLTSTISQISPVPGVFVGEKAPPVKGKDQEGNQVNSETLSETGPVILIFYRGSWCPYCRKHLGNLQDSLALVLDRGASVIVVTPEAPESIEEMIRNTGATFSIIHDVNHQIMDDYGVSFRIDEKTVPRYFGSTLKKTRSANQNEDDVLPVPATFIIGKEHRIAYIHYNPDYRNRMPVSLILEKL